MDRGGFAPALGIEEPRTLLKLVEDVVLENSSFVDHDGIRCRRERGLMAQQPRGRRAEVGFATV